MSEERTCKDEEQPGALVLALVLFIYLDNLTDALAGGTGHQEVYTFCPHYDIEI